MGCTSPGQSKEFRIIKWLRVSISSRNVPAGFCVLADTSADQDPFYRGFDSEDVEFYIQGGRQVNLRVPHRLTKQEPGGCWPKQKRRSWFPAADAKITPQRCQEQMLGQEGRVEQCLHGRNLFLTPAPLNRLLEFLLIKSK
mgnify:CR=1 FL=1